MCSKKVRDMKFERKHLLLYAVTDRARLGGRTLAHEIEAAIRGGATMVQLREKSMGEEDFLAEAKELVKLCHSLGTPVIINDSVRVAMASGADGVHVGQSDGDPTDIRKLAGEDFIIGVTARTVGEAVAAERAGADYIGVGAVFPTSTKTDTRRLTKAELSAITGAVRIPAVAIGGITENNIDELSGTGIAGVAVVSAIFAADDAEAAARRLLTKAEAIVK